MSCMIEWFDLLRETKPGCCYDDNCVVCGGGVAKQARAKTHHKDMILENQI